MKSRALFYKPLRAIGGLQKMVARTGFEPVRQP